MKQTAIVKPMANKAKKKQTQEKEIEDKPKIVKFTSPTRSYNKKHKVKCKDRIKCP